MGRAVHQTHPIDLEVERRSVEMKVKVRHGPGEQLIERTVVMPDNRRPTESVALAMAVDIACSQIGCGEQVLADMGRQVVPTQQMLVVANGLHILLDQHSGREMQQRIEHRLAPGKSQADRLRSAQPLLIKMAQDCVGIVQCGQIRELAA